MKLDTDYSTYYDGEVAPHAGARIETDKAHITQRRKPSRSHAGARIETWVKCPPSSIIVVAPRAGARIEPE